MTLISVVRDRLLALADRFSGNDQVEVMQALWDIEEYHNHQIGPSFIIPAEPCRH